MIKSIFTAISLVMDELDKHNSRKTLHSTSSSEDSNNNSDFLHRNALLSRIIHHVGHDIGNPLTSIISLSSILERFSAEDSTKDIEPEKLNQYSGAIISEAWKISSLNETLVFLLSERETPLSPCILPELLETSLKRMNSRQKETLSNISIQNSLSDELLVNSDADRLCFILTELLKNAAKALNEIEGKKVISVNGSLNNDDVFLRIENTCNTKIECELEELFNPLVSHFKSGIGIGLASVQNIINMLGASVALEEHVNDDGSYKFVAELRLPASEIMQASASSVKEKLQTESEHQDSDITIVIVDDEEMVASAIEKILEMGFAPTQINCLCVSGKEAIKIIDSKTHFDAILCDLNLAEMSGRHVYEHLLNEQPKLQNKFIFLTGDQGRKETLTYLESAGRPYIFKPFEPQDLINIVSNIVE